MGTQLNVLWQNTLSLLEKEVTKASFETWLKPTELASLKNGIAMIQVPNEFARDWLEGRYALLIKNIMQMVTEEELEVRFTIPEEQGSINKKTPLNSHDEIELPQLIPKYTFDTFVVGNSNRFAHAASLAVAEAPAKSYNPLFVYGGVGLGKTHLMQAIAHYVLSQAPNTRILYASSEKFTNELINAIRDGDQTAAFRNKYRNIDILLIDDIQFLAGKERTQEEFFHTFNSLHEANKQIIISSDRPPKEIPTLEDRLRSRFEWGLITDIQPPDVETREAILRKKTMLEKLDVPNEVLIYIAHKIPSNIRELEGALNRVVAYSSLTKMPITVELAAEALKDILPSSKPKIITIKIIQQICAEYFNLQIEDFKAKKRTRAVAFPRQIAMYLSRELTDSSLPKIGEEFGGRDHTTVIHAHEKIQRDINEDPSLELKVQEITKKIQQS